MEFTNPDIRIESLPQTEDTEYNALDQNYLRVAIFGNLIFFGIMAAGLVTAFFISDILESRLLTLGLPALWIFFFSWTMILTVLNFRIQGYALRLHDIIYRRGVLFRRTTTIPFNRVQHCEIKQGPIERFFSLKTLEIYTAGGASSDLKIPGLKDDRALKLKMFIVNHSNDGTDEQE